MLYRHHKGRPIAQYGPVCYLFNTEPLIQSDKAKASNKALCLAYAQIFFKVTNFVLYKDSFKKMLHWMEDLDRRSFDSGFGGNCKVHIEVARKICMTIPKAIFLSYFISAHGFSLNFFITKETIITIPYLPTSEYLYLLLVLQFSVSHAGLTAIFIFDMFVVVIGVHIIFFSNIVQDAIKSLNNIVLMEDGTRNLLQIYKLHYEIIEKVKEFSDSVSLMFLFQISTSAILFVIFFYVIQEFFLDNLLYPMIIAALILQLFITCFLCQIVEVKMEQIYDELCQTNWYDMTSVNKRNFLFCLQMAQRNYGIKAGGMYNVNMMMFIEILKLGFTYCAIMQTTSR
ncbi:hypothetical protein DMENIID0001_012150 [Sergentomyia squamirostris]